MKSASPKPEKISWRIVIAAQLSPANTTAQPVDVDKNSFNDLFTHLLPSLEISVKNQCHSETKHLNLSLSFSNLKDFTPDALVLQIPHLAWLSELKKQTSMYHEETVGPEILKDLIKRNPLPESLYNEFAALPDLMAAKKPDTYHSAKDSAGAQTTGSSDTIDAILSMIDTTIPSHDSTPPPAAAFPLQSGASYTKSSVPEQSRGSRNQLQAIICAIDSILGMQINEILHHPEFIALETAWREVKFIIEHTDYRAGIGVRVISCEKSSFDKVVMDSIFKPVWNEGEAAPDLVASLHPLSRSAPDYELCVNLAQLGASTQTIMVLGAGAAFFGASHYHSLKSSVPSIQLLLNGVGYENWRGLREKDEADWLLIAANSFYLRSSYGDDGVRVKSFRFNEHHKPQNIPCGSASAVVVSLINELIAALGSESMEQFRHRALITDMPARYGYIDSKTGRMQTCVNSLSGDQVWDLADAGLSSVNCAPDNLSITLEGTKTFGKSGYSIASLFLAGHIARLSTSIMQEHGSLPDSELSELIALSLRNLFCARLDRFSGEQVAQAQVTAGENGGRNVSVNVTAPYSVWGEEVVVNLCVEG